MPYIFHFVTVLVNTGPVSLRASINGLVINIIHSLCTCSEPAFSGKKYWNLLGILFFICFFFQFEEDTRKILKLALTEFQMPKFHKLFGITYLTLKQVASTALVSTRGYSHSQIQRASSSEAFTGVADGIRPDALTLCGLEAIADALVELIEVNSFFFPFFSNWYIR